MRFDDQLVVVTGVGQAGQVGAFVARAFAERGARVAMLGIEAGELEARAAEMRGDGLTATAHACDLSDPASTAAAASGVREAHGDAVHALLNVAGGFGMLGPVAESDPAAWHRQFAINLTTAYLATRAFLPGLRAARGAIVYFSSAAALPGGDLAKMAAYGAAKAGVIALMRAVASEERGSGVRANAVAPTAIETATNLASMGEGRRYVSRAAVAETLMHLVSPASSAVSGQVITLS